MNGTRHQDRSPGVGPTDRLTRTYAMSSMVLDWKNNLWQSPGLRLSPIQMMCPISALARFKLVFHYREGRFYSQSHCVGSFVIERQRFKIYQLQISWRWLMVYNWLITLYIWSGLEEKKKSIRLTISAFCPETRTTLSLGYWILVILVVQSERQNEKKVKKNLTGCDRTKWEKGWENEGLNLQGGEKREGSE